jgi:hypothetical protein
VTVELNDGRRFSQRIEHALGSLEVPMCDADLERMLTDLAEETYSRQQLSEVIELHWNTESPRSAGDLARAATSKRLLS